MIITASQSLPSAKELVETLKHEFADQYSYELFGAGEEKTIIVERSFFTGAQFTIRGNEIKIEGIVPSAFASLISILMQQLANLFILFSPSRYKKLEREIGVFLKRKYA